MSRRAQLFGLAVSAMRRLFGAVCAGILGAIFFGLLLLVGHTWIPSISAESGWSAFAKAVQYGALGVAGMAIVGLIWPQWFVKESVMGLDLDPPFRFASTS
jgi:hypothetical protein